MAKAWDQWKVLQHGALEQLADNLWRVEGALPGMPLRRVMTVVRREDELVVHNAVCLDDSSMKRLDQAGVVTAILVPNGWHRLDARVWKQRYPSAKFYCPAGSRARVEQVVEVDGTYDSFPGSDDLRLEHLEGVRRAEGVMRVRSEDGITLVFNDVLFNMPHLPGLQGLVMRLMGSSGGLRVTRFSRLMMVKDRGALRAHLQRLAAEPELRRIIVSHHEMLRQEPARALARVADSL
jgi:hypothetical protein